MTPDQLRDIIRFLEQRIGLGEDGRSITFDVPAEDEMVAAGLDPDGVHRLLTSAWWSEMVEEVIETPEFCEPDDPPDQILQYARDVVLEYVRKRFPLEGE
jgi:hypothetical protein